MVNKVLLVLLVLKGLDLKEHRVIKDLEHKVVKVLKEHKVIKEILELEFRDHRGYKVTKGLLELEFKGLRVPKGLREDKE